MKRIHPSHLKKKKEDKETNFMLIFQIYIFTEDSTVILI